jgi:hypothetical protein
MRREAIIGTAQVVAFLAGWAVFFIGLQVGLIVAWIHAAGHSMSLEGLQAIAASGTPPTDVLLGTLAIQFAGMLTLAFGVLGGGQFLRRWWTGEWVDLRAGLAWRPSTPLTWAAAVAGGFTVGWFPGFVAELVRTWVPALDLGAVNVVGDVLADANVLQAVGMALLIAGVAPVVEELVFRGVLWSALERWLPVPAVIAITSILFAAFHLDPAQAIPLLFTGAFLGWVRWTTGSVGPAIAVHVVNNAFALLLGAVGVEEATGVLVASSVVVTAAVAWVLWSTRTVGMAPSPLAAK